MKATRTLIAAVVAFSLTVLSGCASNPQLNESMASFKKNLGGAASAAVDVAKGVGTAIVPENDLTNSVMSFGKKAYDSVTGTFSAEDLESAMALIEGNKDEAARTQAKAKLAQLLEANGMESEDVEALIVEASK